MEALSAIYNKHLKNGWPDKGSIHSYIEVYEEILAPYRTTAKNILEIGLFGGGSLLMWEDYFTGNVHGIDCSETPHDGMADLRPMIAEGTHNIHIFDATNHFEAAEQFNGIKFDVIIEDAAHSFDQQIQLYNVWKNYLSDGSIMIIEDIQDIDKHQIDFLQMDSSKQIKIIDRRKIKGRYDDVMVVIK